MKSGGRFRRRIGRRRRFPRRRFFAKKRFSRKAKNFATVVEAFEEIAQPYSVGSQRTVNLSQGAFPRSTAVALSYKWFRLAKLEWIYKPKYNMFTEAQTGAVNPSIPYLWTSRAKEMPDSTLDPLSGTVSVTNYQEVGAVQHKFNRQVVLRYKPNSLQTNTFSTAISSDTGTGQAFSPVWNRWFPVQQPQNTTPLGGPNIPLVTYYGHYDFVEQDSKSSNAPVFDIVVRATWQFKEPQLPNTTPS